MKVFIFFALFCLAIASASVIGPLGTLGVGPVAVSQLGVPVAAPGVVVGGLGIPGLIAPGLVGGVKVIG